VKFFADGGLIGVCCALIGDNELLLPSLSPRPPTKSFKLQGRHYLSHTLHAMLYAFLAPTPVAMEPPHQFVHMSLLSSPEQILDATNTTRDRRAMIAEHCKANDCRVLFVESVCENDDQIHQNIMVGCLQKRPLLESPPPGIKYRHSTLVSCTSFLRGLSHCSVPST